jgi:hypothetical protein
MPHAPETPKQESCAEAALESAVLMRQILELVKGRKTVEAGALMSAILGAYCYLVETYPVILPYAIHQINAIKVQLDCMQMEAQDGPNNLH